MHVDGVAAFFFKDAVGAILLLAVVGVAVAAAVFLGGRSRMTVSSSSSDSASSSTVLMVGFGIGAAAAVGEAGFWSLSYVAMASRVAAKALSQASVGKSKSAFAMKGGIKIKLRPL